MCLCAPTGRRRVFLRVSVGLVGLGCILTAALGKVSSHGKPFSGTRESGTKGVVSGAKDGPVGANQAPGHPQAVPWAVGGCGGAYFLASPGTLVIDVYKQDLHRRNILSELRAILAGPDRQVLQEVRIPDDGQTGPGRGPWQWARLTAQVPRQGIYVLNITVSNDRYGEEIAWGFQTNCPKYVIETARGHRDQPHEEPLVMLCPDQPGQIVFQPRLGAFSVEATGLPKEVQNLQVQDAEGRLLVLIPVDGSGRAQHRFPADKNRPNTPWRILLPKQQGVLHVDGLTRWQPDDPAPHIACWTPDPGSWFAWLENRWLLTPYRRVVYGQPGQQGTLRLEVHNNARDRRTIQLRLEFPDSERPIRLQSSPILELNPQQTGEVLVHYTVPTDGKRADCFLRATPQDDSHFSTYSTITVLPGLAPCQKPLPMPLVLKPYAHENEQFGYLPQYPVENQVYFDMENRPWLVSGDGLCTWQEGRWEWRELSKLLSRTPELTGHSFSSATSKLAFDRENHLYLMARSGPQAALLHSSNGGKSFTAYLLPEPVEATAGEGRETFDMEEFTGHNVLDGPPPVLRYRLIRRDPQHFWRWIHHLELIVAEKKQGRIEFHKPVLVSRQCIGLAAHSGIPSSVVSRDGRVHLVWAEASDPTQNVPGVLTYAASYDRQSRRLSKPVLVGYGPPPNDVHNSPSITMDRRGFLHVLCGTHGRPFPYARSLQPNDTAGGWTEAKVVGEGLGQTYIGMVCGQDDSLYIAYRLWQRGKPPHPLSYHATLAFQRKPADGPWLEPQILLLPPFSEYSVYYHRLTIDRQGRLFLSYDYWTTYWFYRNDYRGHRRALLFSADSAQSWKLADLQDLLPLSR